MPLFDEAKKKTLFGEPPPSTANPRSASTSEAPAPQSPVNVMQPSAQPGNPVGNQAPQPAQAVQTGVAPGSLAQSVAPNLNAVKSVSDRVSEITSNDSPLWQAAATRGKQYAQARGLLNSDIGAQAAQAAVLEQAIPLAKSDVDVEIQKYRAGLDERKFESDANYRNKSLAQEKELQDKKLALDSDQLALNKDEQEFRQSIDRDRFQFDSNYRNKVLDQQKELQERRLSLDERVGIGGLSLQEKRLRLETQNQGFYQTLDREKFETDTLYKNTALLQQRILQERKLSLNEELGRGELELNRQKLDLQERHEQFYQGLDRERFESDADYKDRALEQDRHFKEAAAELDVKRMHVDWQKFSHQKKTVLVQTAAQAGAARDARDAAILGNAEIKGPARTELLAKSHQKYLADIKNTAGIYDVPLGTFNTYQAPGDRNPGDTGGTGDTGDTGVPGDTGDSRVDGGVDGEEGDEDLE